MTRRGDSICFDTAPTIWGVRGEASRGQEHEIVKTKRYIQWLKQNNKQIMIPTPVLAEYLVGATATELHEMAILKRSFQIPGLDLASARLAAELQRGDTVKLLQDDFGLSRVCIKADALIAAIAIENHAVKIVTNDEKHFKILVRNRIPVSSVPDVSIGEQATMFGPPDDGNGPE